MVKGITNLPASVHQKLLRKAMVKLGSLNSRMKDFYDIWLMSRMFDFKGQDLAEALEKTFKNRDTELTADPVVFDGEFCADKNKQTQWKAFLKRTKLNNISEDLCEVVAGIDRFLLPILKAIEEGEVPRSSWKASGNWH